MMSIIGLMSGTSVDGIDAALVSTDGTTLARTPHVLTGPYRDVTKQAIMQLLDDPSAVLSDRNSATALEQLIAEDHATVVNELMSHTCKEVALLGFHGQTVYHNPDKSISIQLGSASHLANLTGIPTVFDFRHNDMANGGQGAPLAPIYHQYLLEHTAGQLPAAFVNIGGISNVTYWDGDKLVGFDCGPGNCLMDDYMRKHYSRAYDRGGAIAAQGKADTALLTSFMQDAYFSRAAPKSLDRQYFASSAELLAGLNTCDAMATLNAFTAESVALSLQQLPGKLKRLIVSGGGQHNTELIRALTQRLPCDVSTANAQQLDGDYTEAELMAFLAARHYYQLPYTFPGTTGVISPCSGGSMAQPAIAE